MSVSDSSHSIRIHLEEKIQLLGIPHFLEIQYDLRILLSVLRHSNSRMVAITMRSVTEHFAILRELVILLSGIKHDSRILLVQTISSLEHLLTRALVPHQMR